MATIGVLVAPRAADAGLNVWTTAGPEGGPITVLAVDPKTKDVLYAGTQAGGVYKSTTGGSFWTPVNAGLIDLGIRALAIDPQTPSTIYAGAGTVFKSTNGGAGWSDTGGPGFGTVTALAVDPQTPTILYAGTRVNYRGNGMFDGGVFKSTNGGASWNASSAGLSGSPTIRSSNWLRHLTHSHEGKVVTEADFRTHLREAHWVPQSQVSPDFVQTEGSFVPT